MKRLLSVVVIIFISTLVANVFAFGSGTWTFGNIILKNGENLDSVWFNMPVMHENKVKLKINGKDVVLQADSIEHIVLWSKQYPEIRYIFKSFRPNYFNPKDSTLRQSGVPIWLCLEAVAKNCTKWHEIGRPDFKKGKLRFKFNKMYSYIGRVYIMRNTDVAPCFIPDKSKDAKKWVEFFFGDDPVLVEKFRNGEYEAKDWGYKYTDYDKIIEDYTPSISENQQSKPE